MMKLILSIVVLFAGFECSFASADAGPSARKPITFIPTLGISLASITGTDSFDNTTGFVGGVLGDFDIGHESLSIESGLLYLQDGGAKNGATLTINYLAIPILAKYTFATNQMVGFNVKGGLMPAILTGSKAAAGSLSADVTSQLASFDLQLALGAGLAYAVNDNLKLTFDLMYTRGLLKVNKDGGTDNNQAFLIMVGAAL